MTARNQTVALDPVTPGSRIPRTLVAVALTAVALAVLTIVLLRSGSPAVDPVAEVQSVSQEDAAPDAPSGDEQDDGQPDDLEGEPEDDGLGTIVPATTSEVFLARDPFEPVVPEDFGMDPETDQPADPADPLDPDAPTDPLDPDDPSAPLPEQPSDPSDPADPLDPADPSDPGDPADPRRQPSEPADPADPDPDDPLGTCFGDDEVVCDGQVVTLVEVTVADGEPVAVVQVDTTVYEVQRGQIFADHFQVRAIDGTCVSLLYGDDGFQLCEGDVVLK